MSLIIKGDKALIRKLRAIAGKDAKNIIRKASRSALRPIHFAARANVTVESGALRKAIKLRALKRSRRRVGHQILISAPHAWIQEKGGNKGKPNYKKQEYIGPAVDHNKEQAFSIFKREVANGILALAKRG